MSQFYLKTADGFVHISRGAPFTDSKGIKHPGNALDVWSKAELEAAGVFEVPAPARTPGKKLVSEVLEVVNGRPRRVVTEADPTLSEVVAERIAALVARRNRAEAAVRASADATSQQLDACLANCRKLAADIRKAASAAEVLAVDTEAGWPV